MNQTYDAIVIGAGVIGASVAYNLSRRGLKVLILERQTVGAGATGASSGLVRMHYDIEVDSALAWASFQFFRNWRECIGGECGFTQTGFLQLVRPEQTPALRANVAAQREAQDALVVALEETLRLSEQRFRSGIDGYLGVLVAQQALYRAELASVETAVERVHTQYQAVEGMFQ